ncbi:hypothetical protein AB205_0131230 [Aquarana catesbeiana]|uniref:Uncharacterized protein n=1 Tax=Aquarana catesbeiana TaxID=8400 RepID=A0A2G9QLQ1_AQUCT|nr:hypothetical protein AB205_0131230 [Aquarana catesbeiana]
MMKQGSVEKTLGRKEEGHLSCVWTPVTQHFLKIQKVNSPDTLKKMLMCRKYCVKFLKTVSTTGDVDIVEDQNHFSSASAQILISELLVCNRVLERMKENMHDLQNRVINIINILAKI